MNPADGPTALAYKDAVFLSPHKFIGGPGTPGVLVAKRAPVHRTACPRCRAAARSPTSTRVEHRYLARSRAPRGGRHAGDRRVDPRRARLPAQGGGRRADHPRARGRLHPARHRLVGGEPEPRDPRQPRRRAALDRLVRGAPRRRATCTTTSSSRCSTICSASRPAAAARAPGPTGTACSASISSTSREFEREIVRGCEGIKPGWVRVNFNYFISRDRSSSTSSTPSTSSPTTAGSSCPHYRFEPETGAVAPPPRRRRAPAMSLRDLSYRSRQARVPLAPRDRARGRAARRTSTRRAASSPTPPPRSPSDAARSTTRRSPPTSRTLRWFPLPREVLAELQGHAGPAHERSFRPRP